MKKKGITMLISGALASSILFSSCIGSFSLSNKLLDWNKSIDSKFVNELVFIAFCIVPVYGVSMLADAVVLNSIEFWTGDNPVADVGSIKKVNGKDGIYTVETKKNGYHIQKEGQKKSVDLVFDSTDKSWSVEADGQTNKLMKFENNDEVVMYLPDGKEMNVGLNQAGVLAFKQVVENTTYFAAR